MRNKSHLTDEGLDLIREIKSGMNNPWAEELKCLYPLLVVVNSTSSNK